MNKKSILYVAAVIIFSWGMKPVNGQVTLLHSFEGRTSSYIGQPSTDFVGFCEDNRQNHTVKLYDKNCQLIKTINVPVHRDDAFFSSFMPSQKIVNDDDLYEIIIHEQYYDEYDDRIYYNYIINENGQMVFDFGNHHNIGFEPRNLFDTPLYGYFYIGGSWILCIEFADYDLGQIVYDVYSCAGSAHNAIPSTQQYQSSFIDVYPNPTNDKLIVHSPNSFSAQSASVYGENGVEELSIPLLTNGQEIDVSSLPRGVHFLRIVTDKGVATKRFVRQ